MEIYSFSYRFQIKCRRATIGILSLALAILASSAMPSVADEQSAALLSPDDLIAAAKPGFQGVSSGQMGAIHYPDAVLAIPVAQTDDNRDLLTAWNGSYIFCVIPIELGIDPPSGFIPERVTLSLVLPGNGQPSRQILVIDSFPKTGFLPSAISGNATLKVGANLKFAGPVPISTDNSVDASLSVKYAPSYANVVSGFGSSSAFWEFSRSQDKYPVGDLPVKIILAIPRTLAGQSIAMSGDIRIEYSGIWWQKGSAIATFRTKASLPSAK